MATKLPQNISVSYYRNMLKQIRMMEKLMEKVYREKIMPLLLELENEKQREAAIELKTNAMILGSLSERLRQLQERTTAQISTELSSVSLEIQRLFNRELSAGIAKKFVDKVNTTDKQNTTKAMIRAGGKAAKTKLNAIEALQDAGTRSIVKSSMDRNISLIQSIPQKYLQKVQSTIYEGLASGSTAKAISKEVSSIGGVTERRAQFIARDQLASVYGDLTKQRQQSLGIKRFKWLTSHDERVRDTHAALDGKIFDWDTGASGSGVPSGMVGLKPGEDFNCRCTSTFVKEDLLAALDKLSEE